MPCWPPTSSPAPWFRRWRSNLLKEHDPEEREKKKSESRNPLVRGQLLFEHKLTMRNFYHRLLHLAIEHSVVFLILFVLLTDRLGRIFSTLGWGRISFPPVDAGALIFTFAPQTGTRIEDTASPLRPDRRRDPPARSPRTSLSPSSITSGFLTPGLNLSYSSTGVVGPGDADITVSLTRQASLDGQIPRRDLRAKLPSGFPGVTFYTLPVDMVTQILNFGLPAPIDIQVRGPNLEANRVIADKLLRDISYVPGATDLRIQQPFNNPNLDGRRRPLPGGEMGSASKTLRGSLLVATSGSFQTSPTFWLDPKSGISYDVAAQAPQYTLDSLTDLANIPGDAAKCNHRSGHGQFGRGFDRSRGSTGAGSSPVDRRSSDSNSGQPGNHPAEARPWPA